MSNQSRPFQFSLRAIFGLMTFVSLCVGLVPALNQANARWAPIYLLLSLGQLACARSVLRHLRTEGRSRGKPEERPYELALLGAYGTLTTAVLVVAWVITTRTGTSHVGWSAFLVALGVASAAVHVPLVCLQVIGFLVMRGEQHSSLPLLLTLNIVNSLIVFGVGVAWLIGGLEMRGFGPPG